MSNDLTRKDPTSLDSFAGWEDGVEGDDQPQGAGVIVGDKLKFSNEGTWLNRSGDEIPPNLELAAVDVGRFVQKWGEGGEPLKTIPLEAHQKFPDIEKMNAEAPKEEWVEGPDGRPRGPWQSSHVLYLVDLKTMNRFSYPTSTIGGRIAIRDLRDKIVWMRRLRGRTVYPIITLGKTWMNTKFGGRFRPFFVIVRWVRLGGEGSGEVEALPTSTPSTTAQLDAFAAPAAKPVEQPLTQVQEPSLKEDLNDEIPDFSESGEAEATPPLPPTRRNPKKSAPAKSGARNATRRLTNLDAG